MFSCCRSNPKAGKREKDKKNEDDEVQANEKGESQLNGKSEIQKESSNEEPLKPEKQAIEADNPTDEGIKANTAQQTQAEAANKSPPAPAQPALVESPKTDPAPKETEGLARSTHSSTSTAPPASMTSGDAEEADEVVVSAVIPTTPPPQPPPTKSCLSRHNSTHQSIKKKVNISNRAEIIEPDPVPLLLLASQNQNSLLDDDEVFSDSLPPPKRESMCAPYIEGDVVSETLFFAHGLPSWFDDERLNEIGCIEPPVTPVGRDELELKRQRLYTELLRAAHAAVEHSVAVRDNEPEAKPTAAVEHLESICERLETLVDRLERTLTAPIPIDLPTPTLPPPPVEEEVEEALPVVKKVDKPQPPSLPPSNNMSVNGFEDIVAGPLSQYLSLSAKIGGDVAQHAELVKSAFGFQLQYVTLATQIAQPAQPKQAELLKPTSTQISAIQDFREKHRSSALFNHLSAISESIPALGWVCVEKTPGPYVKEMNDAGQFYTNRVLKEWKEKDVTHVEWARAWVQTLTELQAYIRQYHTTGLVWSGKGAAPAGGAPPPPPPGGLPPPPPMLDLSALKLESGGDDRSALFAQINQGADITKGLKKVTGDMQTHKNPSLRTGPAPFKSPAQSGGNQTVAAPSVAPAKAPVFERDGKKWIIEYQKNNTGLLVENAEMNNVVYVFRCEGSTLTVKGKVNNIVFDSCKKCSLLFDSVVASVEFVNCQSVQMQVLGSVPTVSIDKTDGCQMYLSKDSLGVEIVNSKSSEMNILLPDDTGDYTELALPEQYKTTIAGKTLKTVCVDSLG
ncbi:adenylyl cyclase-associated protein 1 isoform X2 [Drosophila eugracilis]|uniref:adenylyl cyclase-associated protein 1 isoform X2 n=2 Tax=Drosophila eugracilis TaxID=29029 RepID=UPI001BDA0B55|nr:adenylyl cyclase-associated protein 1 isoform X2 [Drosophila eugracilis]